MGNQFEMIDSQFCFFKDLENYTFESKMMICQLYSSRIMTKSEVSRRLILQENIMPWELETFVTFSIVYDTQSATENITLNKFWELIKQLRQFYHPKLDIAEKEGQFADHFVLVTALQQFPIQGVFIIKLFRYDYFFNFSNTNVDMKSIFFDMFKNEYRKFAVFAYIVFILFSTDAQKLLDTDCRLNGLKKAFAIGTVREQLSININDYQVRLNELYGGNILEYYYGLKIQYQYPIIEKSDYAYLPLPFLIINSVTESLLNRITFNNNELRRIFGKEIIEEYLFSIYKEVSSVTWISREFKYKKRKQSFLTPDVLVEESDKALLFDTKALVPSIKIRKLEDKEIEREVDIYAKNVFQMYSRILDLVEGNFSLKHSFNRNDIFGIVVVLEDAEIPRHKVYNKVFNLLSEKGLNDSSKVKDYIHSHIKVVPLQEIENVVLMGNSFMECLLKQVNKQNEWDNLTFYIPSQKSKPIPIYEKFYEEIKKEVKNVLLQ